MKKLFVLLCFLPIVGCAPDLNSDDYETAHVGQVACSEEGTVILRREVRINYYERGPVSEGATSGISTGATAGALAGAAGSDSLAGMAAGALIGAAIGGGIGYGVESATRTHPGFEYHIKLVGTKKIVVVTQGIKPDIPVGSKVLVITPQKTGNYYNRAMRTRVVLAQYS